MIGSFSDLRMVFQGSSASQGWVGRGDLNEIAKRLTEVGRELSEFIILEVKEGKFQALLSSHLSAATEIFDKMKTEECALHVEI